MSMLVTVFTCLEVSCRCAGSLSLVQLHGFSHLSVFILTLPILNLSLYRHLPITPSLTTQCPHANARTQHQHQNATTTTTTTTTPLTPSTKTRATKTTTPCRSQPRRKPGRARERERRRQVRVRQRVRQRVGKLEMVVSPSLSFLYCVWLCLAVRLAGKLFGYLLCPSGRGSRSRKSSGECTPSSKLGPSAMLA